jgi:hypothetical protein
MIDDQLKRLIEKMDSIIAEENPRDVVSMDIPLLIRLLEYAREDANSDMDLHSVTENMIGLSDQGRTLTMNDYDAIVNQPSSQDM